MKECECTVDSGIFCQICVEEDKKRMDKIVKMFQTENDIIPKVAGTPGPYGWEIT